MLKCGVTKKSSDTSTNPHPTLTLKDFEFVEVLGLIYSPFPPQSTLSRIISEYTSFLLDLTGVRVRLAF